MFLLSFAAATAGEAIREPRVAFSPSGDRVAVELLWTEDGSGFPNARVEIWDPARGERVGEWSARLTEDESKKGLDGAQAAARQAAAAELGRANIDLTKPATLTACKGGVCGSTEGSGCTGKDQLKVTVTSTPTDSKADQCRTGKPELLAVSVPEKTWLSESTPADGCPKGDEAAWGALQGESAVLLVTYATPSSEGAPNRVRAVAGRVR